MRFYLGTHHPHWLERVRVPLFVSHNRLRGRKALPRALSLWAVDSGGFTRLTADGNWDAVPAREYVRCVRRYRDEIGQLEWAAVQDWMCEPVVRARTGLSIAEHQLRTIQSYEALSELAPEVRWLPVLQGWGVADYWRHVDMYSARGHVLTDLHRVGLGSVCRRQATAQAEAIVSSLSAEGIRLHLFGFKKLGLARLASSIDTDSMSSDSAAWSQNARRNLPLPGHNTRHLNCANCMEYALLWRDELVASVSAAERRRRELQQMAMPSLFDVAEQSA